MKPSKKLISLLLAVLMVLTSLTVGVSAFAADDTDAYREALTSFEATPINKSAIDNDYLNAEGGIQLIVDALWPAIAADADADGTLGLADGLDGYLSARVYTASTLNALYDKFAEWSHDDTALGLEGAAGALVPDVGTLVSSVVFQNAAHVSGLLAQSDNAFAGAIDKINAVQWTQEDQAAGVTLLDKLAQIEFTAEDFGFTDGDRDGFVDALLAVLRPLTNLLNGGDVLAQAGITLNMFDTADGEGIYSILLPTLEQLGLTGLPTAAEYEANYNAVLEKDGQNCALDEYLRPIVASVFENVVDPISADPLNGLIEVLPRFAYVIDGDRLDTAANDVIASMGDAAAGLADAIDLSTETINNKIAATTVDISSAEGGLGLIGSTDPVPFTLQPVDWTALSNAAYVNLAESSTEEPYFVLRTGDTENVAVQILTYVYQVISNTSLDTIDALLDALIDQFVGGLFGTALKAVLYPLVHEEIANAVSADDGVGILLGIFSIDLIADELQIPALEEVSMYNTSSAHGKLDPAGFDVTGAKGGHYVYTVNADEGYVIYSLTVNGEPVEDAVGQYHYAALAEVGSGIKVIFKAAGADPAPVQYVVSSSAGNNGTIDPQGEKILNEGESCTFTVTADDGYAINQLTVNGKAINEAAGQRTYTYTVSSLDDALTIRATFRVYTHVVRSTAGANGAISPSGLALVRDGVTKTYTATADSGYIIDTFTVNNEAYADASGQSAYTVTLEIRESTEISVTFKKIPVRTKAQVMVSSLNVKASASNSSTTLVRLTSGNLAYIDGEEGEWYKVSFTKGGVPYSGYLEKKFVKIVAGQPKDKGIVVAGTAKVYTSTMAGSTEATLKRGQYAYIDGEQGNYYLVSFSLGGWHYGYIRKDYLRDDSLARNYTSTWSERQAQVMTSEVIVRDDASTNSAPVTVLTTNNKIYINGEEGEWYKVSFSLGGQPYNGYAEKKYFRVVAGQAKPKGIVVAGTANVYASTAASKIEATLKRDQYAYIDGEIGDYYLVSFSLGGWHYGYIRKDYLRDDSLPRNYTVVRGDTLGTVTANELVVRDEASADSAPVTVLTKNNKVYINGESGAWYKVSFTLSGQPYEGYVLKVNIDV